MAVSARIRIGRRREALRSSSTMTTRARLAPRRAQANPPAKPTVAPKRKYRKLDGRLVEDFARLTRRGLPIDAACDYLGVATASLYHWVKQGKAYLDSEVTQRIEEHAACADFVMALRRATAEYRLERVDRLHRSSGKTWIREMTILERRDRKNFGRRDPAGGDEERYDPDERFL